MTSCHGAVTHVKIRRPRRALSAAPRAGAASPGSAGDRYDVRLVNLNMPVVGEEHERGAHVVSFEWRKQLSFNRVAQTVDLTLAGSSPPGAVFDAGSCPSCPYTARYTMGVPDLRSTAFEPG